MPISANLNFRGSSLEAFRATLNAKDKERLDAELTGYAKTLIAAMLFESSSEELREELSEGSISPLVFQWSLAVRDGLEGQTILLASTGFAREFMR